MLPAYFGVNKCLKNSITSIEFDNEINNESMFVQITLEHSNRQVLGMLKQ